jgi:hypothetical protein
MKGKIYLCDFARATDNGTRFDVIGAGINQIAFSILIETNITLPEKYREQSFELRIIDPDGKNVVPPINGNVNFSKDSPGPLYAAFNMQLMMNKPVSLTFSLLINNEEKDSVTVQINRSKVLPTE